MSLSEAIKNILQNKEELLSYRLQSSKIFFICSTLVFFLNYLFVGAGFLVELVGPFLSGTYTVFLFSYLIFISLTLLYYLRGKMRILAYVGILGLVLIFGAFLLPVLIGK